ncbi:TPA: hypothetical protein NOV85_003399 [Pseudomonas aeruginosa]|uniref:hypothetical protein n=1 Tax=Pseudomonas aeruginosa TaxID=287 RepID=UPI000C2CC010|nr:hypothetical protein [Pseudomonas aeruginosa]AUA83946.1 hypothetical protein CWI22_16660 [Pseudomonas aeruginosa]AUA85232.1 hypothetical protein CWI22_23530 [Pseudomonas aeruginosa]AUA90037.1 hypothetical protein CWI23_16705 [Pseudomonas aeruginosa]AUA91323.1 hypothetical protein CWI23_23575 [Pseudomonas aeruginosa]AVE32255.1 hypothetical protein HV91_08720 [Pseudomonas aeruginosa]
MKGYALVQGPRRKVLYISDSCYLLWEFGGSHFKPELGWEFRTLRQNRAICKENNAYIVRLDFKLGDPISTPKRKKLPREAGIEVKQNG